MLSKAELLTAIDELEDSAPTFQNCQKMATFYTLLNSMYRSAEKEEKQEIIREEIISDHGNSDFLRLIAGRHPDDVWRLMDELMNAIQISQPKLYTSVMMKLEDML